jgi:hypothetical protein
LKASETDLENIVYREKDAREVLEYDFKQLSHECVYHMVLREASNRDLVNCYKSLQKLNKDCGGCATNSKSLRKPHSQLRGFWFHIQADPRLLHW